MSETQEFVFNSDSFSGRARLFPLPGLVLFPHVLQPLHVFEPRYREMLEDALAGDRLITMAMLSPGWEKDYEGRPPVHRFACLGHVATHQRLEDGRYNLLLLGLKRVEIVRELAPGRAFREAEVTLREDQYPAETAAARTNLRRGLLEVLGRLLKRLPQGQQQLDQLLSGDLPLGMLTDIVAYTLDLDLQFKTELLAEVNVDRRAVMLLEHLKSTAAGMPTGTTSAIKFPPDFSDN